MTIKVGDKMPSATLYEMGEGGPKAVSTDELFKGKTVVLFGVPGAFTPTCSAKHLPGYVEQSAAIKAKGADEIVCMSVNDAFVMSAWGKDQNTGDKVRMVADGSAELTKKMGFELDLAPRGLGMRGRRFSMVVKDGVVSALNLEEGGAFEVSAADRIIAQI